jgi:hypothetical protein
VALMALSKMKKIVVFFVKRVESHAATLNDIPFGLLFRNRLGNRTKNCFGREISPAV